MRHQRWAFEESSDETPPLLEIVGTAKIDEMIIDGLPFHEETIHGPALYDPME